MMRGMRFIARATIAHETSSTTTSRILSVTKGSGVETRVGFLPRFHQRCHIVLWSNSLQPNCRILAEQIARQNGRRAEITKQRKPSHFTEAAQLALPMEQVERVRNGGLPLRQLGFLPSSTSKPTRDSDRGHRSTVNEYLEGMMGRIARSSVLGCLALFMSQGMACAIEVVIHPTPVVSNYQPKSASVVPANASVLPSPSEQSPTAPVVPSVPANASVLPSPSEQLPATPVEPAVAPVVSAPSSEVVQESTSCSRSGWFLPRRPCRSHSIDCHKGIGMCGATCNRDAWNAFGYTPTCWGLWPKPLCYDHCPGPIIPRLPLHLLSQYGSPLPKPATTKENGKDKEAEKDKANGFDNKPQLLPKPKSEPKEPEDDKSLSGLRRRR